MTDDRGCLALAGYAFVVVAAAAAITRYAPVAAQVALAGIIIITTAAVAIAALHSRK